MITLDKVQEQAPGLVSLAKTAAVSLTKHNIAGQRAAVYLVVDRSYSMHPYYRDGSVQHLADQALGLSVNLDDDGLVPLVFFDTRPYPLVDVRLGEHEGVVARQHELFGGEGTMGGTQYAAAMQVVVEDYARSATTDPALVIFQTDGAPQDASTAAMLLTRYAKRPLFWAFIGFGPTEVAFLKRLDTLEGRAVDNASYFHAGARPRDIADSVLYDAITGEFAAWLPAARAAGVLA